MAIKRSPETLQADVERYEQRIAHELTRFDMATSDIERTARGNAVKFLRRERDRAAAAVRLWGRKPLAKSSSSGKCEGCNRKEPLAISGDARLLCWSCADCQPVVRQRRFAGHEGEGGLNLWQVTAANRCPNRA